ncbi:hypothetical protein Tco_0934076 [Tanacetum coccineum]
MCLEKGNKLLEDKLSNGRAYRVLNLLINELDDELAEKELKQCGVNLLLGTCLNCTYGNGKPITCCGCEGPLKGGFCSFCASRDGNSFAYDPKPNSSDYPPQPRYVVPTGRVVVPTGRYVVPAGKIIIIVSPGRLSLVPTGRVLSLGRVK